MTNELVPSTHGLLVAALVGLVACGQSQAPGPQLAQAPAEDRTQPNPDRNAYSGEEHLHTSWSVDAC